jgi:integrase
MGYVTTKKGVRWVRLVVPDDLVSVIGKKNLMETLATKDNRVATERAPAVIAKFQQQIAEARAKLGGYVYVPATSHAEILTRVIRRGGFGGRMLLKSEAANLPAPDTTPVIVEPPPEVIEAICRARQQAKQRDAVTVTDDPVTFESIVELWARENKVPDPTKRLYLSKTVRFVRWLKTDREIRGVAACADDMRLVTREEYIRYREDLLKPDSGLGHTTVKHHLDDLRTLFKFASKNRSFANPTNDVTRLDRKNGRSKWRPYTLDERIRILTGARKEGPVIRWCQWVGWATGARVSEITEASTKDVCQIGGMWCIKILLDDREEDASLKNEESHRIVALHSALIREGFLDYVESIRRQYGDGPLFPMLKPDRDGRRGNPASRRISKWMRNKLKIKDKRIAPNHSWRHTFESAHRNELEPATREDTVNHITGRSQGGASGRHYGIYEIRRDRIEIEKMPCALSQAGMVADAGSGGC